MQFCNTHFRYKRLQSSGKLRTKQQNCPCIMESLEIQSHNTSRKSSHYFTKSMFCTMEIFPKLFSYRIFNNYHPKYLPLSNRILGSFLLKESKKHQTSPGNILDPYHHPVLSNTLKICFLQNQREDLHWQDFLAFLQPSLGKHRNSSELDAKNSAKSTQNNHAPSSY